MRCGPQQHNLDGLVLRTKGLDDHARQERSGARVAEQQGGTCRVLGVSCDGYLAAITEASDLERQKRDA